MQEVLSDLQLLGEKNGTTHLVHDTWEFIKRNINNFRVDFNNTSRKERFSSGELEPDLFEMLAAMCRYENGNNNAKMASKIMIEIGYNSYAERPNRFRQKVENLKKKKKKIAKRKKIAKEKKIAKKEKQRSKCNILIIKRKKIEGYSTVSDYPDGAPEPVNVVPPSCSPSSHTEAIPAPVYYLVKGESSWSMWDDFEQDDIAPVYYPVVGESTVSSFSDNSIESDGEPSWHRWDDFEQSGYDDDKDAFLGHDLFVSTFDEDAIFEGFMPNLF